jgi:hypothetical protein
LNGVPIDVLAASDAVPAARYKTFTTPASSSAGMRLPPVLR